MHLLLNIGVYHYILGKKYCAFTFIILSSSYFLFFRSYFFLHTVNYVAHSHPSLGLPHFLISPIDHFLSLTHTLFLPFIVTRACVCVCHSEISDSNTHFLDHKPWFLLIIIRNKVSILLIQVALFMVQNVNQIPPSTQLPCDVMSLSFNVTKIRIPILTEKHEKSIYTE
jgi:hypothetical protein